MDHQSIPLYPNKLLLVLEADATHINRKLVCVSSIQDSYMHFASSDKKENVGNTYRWIQTLKWVKTQNA